MAGNRKSARRDIAEIAARKREHEEVSFDRMTFDVEALGGSPQVRRTPSGRLIVGLLILPWIFGWFLAARGYANSTRAIVAVYALVAPALIAFNDVLVG
ncbi:hypothetical protein [Sphingomonas hylomeconis]|uniref:Uncharacterized protein n=1 Tax=Sphingomonas hylomeconis TaxID=1395958 RepID=A0ABV7SXT9_9SPHN|nr:hypothetical protein [Sphingomonas hylomeconis]